MAEYTADDFYNWAACAIGSIRMASRTTASQLEGIGGLGPGSSWELHDDLTGNIGALIRVFPDRLELHDLRSFKTFLSAVENSPKEPEQGLLDSSWDELRTKARQTLSDLVPFIRKVNNYFNDDSDWLHNIGGD